MQNEVLCNYWHGNVNSKLTLTLKGATLYPVVSEEAASSFVCNLDLDYISHILNLELGLYKATFFIYLELGLGLKKKSSLFGT